MTIWNRRNELLLTISKVGLHPKIILLSIWWDKVPYYDFGTKQLVHCSETSVNNKKKKKSLFFT